jgi:iron complex transport system ATP-binding protein
MIKVNQLTIERAGRAIISDFSTEIPSASITAIIGPNGSGKSTLLAAIAGDLAPISGEIKIDGVNPYSLAANELAHLRAMSLQNQPFLMGFTVRQVIEFAGPADQVMTDLELSHLAERQVTNLSGGEAQRVAIAQALAQMKTNQCSTLLLDEPLSAQDTESRNRIIELLKKLAKAGATIVVVVHSSEEKISWADKVLKPSL